MSGDWTILKVLDWTRGHFEKKELASPRLDAEVLMAHALGIERVMLYAHFNQPLDGEELAKIRDLVGRRAKGEPVAYLTGNREFWSLPFEVSPAVLVPRPDTELLVEVALDAGRKMESPTVVDVGTGTGCIACALAKELETARVFALERSPEALAIAQKNCETLELQARVTVVESDLLNSLPEEVEKIDLLCANLPYIPSGKMEGLMTDVRDFEPHAALDGGTDGLDFIRPLIEQAQPRMIGGGVIVLEADPEQMDAIQDLLQSAGFEGAERKEIQHEDGGVARVISARYPG